MQAIHDEIETVLERYLETMGPTLESLKEGQPLMVYYPIVSDYFTIYNGNSFLIGRIPDNDLRKQIIKTYTLAKGMIDSYRMNNDLFQKYEYWYQLFEESKNQVQMKKAEVFYNALVEYAKKLKLGHDQIKSEIAQLLRNLRKQGVLSEKKN